MEKGKEEKSKRMCKEIEVAPDEVEGYKGQGFKPTIVRMYKELEVQPEEFDQYEKDGFQTVGEPIEEHEHKGEHNKEGEKHKAPPARR